MDAEIHENLKKAFRTGSSGIWEQCPCGKKYYDGVNQWDWEEGEFEELENDPEATRLSYGVETVNLQGTYYCMDCTCWTELADRIIGFLYANRVAIAEFYQLERRRLEHKAGTLPIINPVVRLTGGRKIILED